MASYNIEMQCYNGNGYDTLYPKISGVDLVGIKTFKLINYIFTDGSSSTYTIPISHLKIGNWFFYLKFNYTNNMQEESQAISSDNLRLPVSIFLNNTKTLIYIPNLTYNNNVIGGSFYNDGYVQIQASNLYIRMGWVSPPDGTFIEVYYGNYSIEVNI